MLLICYDVNSIQAPLFRYNFKHEQLDKAHQFNQIRVEAALKQKDRLVIVDNTNTMSWEMRPYFFLAAQYKYTIFIEEPKTSWFFKPKESCELIHLF